MKNIGENGTELGEENVPKRGQRVAGEGKAFQRGPDLSSRVLFGCCFQNRL